jgi:hypothetical protein
MLRFAETPAGWEGCRYRAEGELDILDTAAGRAGRTAPPREALAGVWREAVAAGLLALPAAPRRADTGLVVEDGHGYVLEWFDGQAFGAAEADNPQAFKSADDEHLERVVGAAMALMRHYQLNECRPASGLTR